METIESRVLTRELAELDLDDVLALLVVPGLACERARGLCLAALARLGGLRRIVRMSPAELDRELEGLPGWPEDGAVRVAAGLELGRRAARQELPLGRIVQGAADLEPHLRSELRGRLKESFVVVLLDAKNRPLRTERVSEGCLTWSVVHPREVFAPAVREAAGAIVVAHNHPSGDPTPSAQDVEVTTRLAKVGEVLGIPLLDHIVVGHDRCVSLRAEGFLERERGWT